MTITVTVPHDDPTTLYRLHDHAGALLYIGIARSWPSRMAQHQRHQPWWPDVARISIDQHPSRTAAVFAEREAIRTEHPHHNVVHNRDGHAAHGVTTIEPPPTGMLGGYYFLTPERQGRVVEQLGDHASLVEYYRWDSGAPERAELVDHTDMADWTFYPDHDTFLSAADQRIDQMLGR